MKTVNSLASLQRADVPSRRSLRGIMAAAGHFILSSDELPDSSSRSLPANSQKRFWTVSGSLTRQTAGGTLTAKSICQVSAFTKDEALSLAAAEMQNSCPGYCLSGLRAELSPAI